MSALEREFRAHIEDWAGPLGPFRSMEELDNARLRFAREIGTEGLDACIREVSAWGRDDPLTNEYVTEAVDFFLRVVELGHGRALSEAVMRLLRSDGPPALLDIWGLCGSREQTTDVLRIVNRFSGDEDLNLALAGALGDIGGAGAVEALQQIRAQAQGEELVSDVDLALTKLNRDR